MNKYLSSLLLLLLVGCNNQKETDQTAVYKSGDVCLKNVQVRVAKGTQNSAAYLTITNTGAGADTLLKVASFISKRVEIHDHKSETNADGIEIKKMYEVGKLTIDAGKSVTLKPGGKHIMLLKLSRDINEGDGIPLTLSFQHAGDIKVMAVAAKIIKSCCCGKKA